MEQRAVECRVHTVHQVLRYGYSKTNTVHPSARVLLHNDIDYKLVPFKIKIISEIDESELDGEESKRMLLIFEGSYNVLALRMLVYSHRIRNELVFGYEIQCFVKKRSSLFFCHALSRSS
jgi:hypothetical protein